MFPGGLVEDLDRSDLARSAVAGSFDEDDMYWIRAGLRELVEECGIWITTPQMPSLPDVWLREDAVYETALQLGVRFDADRVVYFDNWVTPTMIPMRFDTRFYAVAVDDALQAKADPKELAAAEWLTPSGAMLSAKRSERVIPFPTVKTLERLSSFSSPAEFVAHARNIDDVPSVLPRGRVGADGSVEVVLPWDLGYDELADSKPDPELLSTAAAEAAARGHLSELVDGAS